LIKARPSSSFCPPSPATSPLRRVRQLLLFDCTQFGTFSPVRLLMSIPTFQFGTFSFPDTQEARRVVEQHKLQYARRAAARSTLSAEVAKIVHVTDDSDLCNTDNWWNDKFSSSAPIPTSSPSAPHIITPPTSVPAGIETPMTTKNSAHDHVYSNFIPFRGPPATSFLSRTNSNDMAQSTSPNSLDQRISHINKIHRNLPRITIGEHVIFLPPISTTSEVNIHTSLRFQDTEGSETHIENHIEYQIAVTKVMSLTNSAVQNAPCVPTPNIPGCTLSVQQNAPYAPTPISLRFQDTKGSETHIENHIENQIAVTKVMSLTNSAIQNPSPQLRNYATTQLRNYAT
jgi:hypothetical protein